MNGRAHVIIGVTVTSAAFLFKLSNVDVMGLASRIIPSINLAVPGAGIVSTGLICKYIDVVTISSIAATFPDLDLKVPFMKHRTWTHSLLLAILTTWLMYSFSKGVGIAWGISYMSHLLADSLTAMGVPFLYPLVKERYGLKIL